VAAVVALRRHITFIISTFAQIDGDL